MNGSPEYVAPEDHSSAASGAESPMEIPGWAPLEPLLSVEVLLATFSGAQPVTASDILNPAYDLVECQRGHRQAVEVLADTEASYTDLCAAAKMLVTAQAEIDMLIAVVDDAVLARMMQRCKVFTRAPLLIPARLDQLPQIATYTDSIGEIAAKMAILWERAVATGADPMAAALAFLGFHADHGHAVRRFVYRAPLARR